MKALNLTGLTFGRLTVLSRVGSKKGKAQWNARCECGADKVVAGDGLQRGTTVSCGCRRAEAMLEGRTKLHDESRTHGKSTTALYEIWRGILKRCTDEKCDAYKNYGGRGIRVHAEWLSDFEAFERDVLASIGERPSPRHSIDRVDNDGNYEPGNVRWATPRQQVENSRTYKNGITHWTKIELIDEVERLRVVVARLRGALKDIEIEAIDALEHEPEAP